jgi:hypothetical protein
MGTRLRDMPQTGHEPGPSSLAAFFSLTPLMYATWQDDGQELMCCERCNKWQHIRCHDQADFITGRPRRNWELDDFLCSACATKNHSASQGSSSQQPQPQSHGFSSHAQAWAHYNSSTATGANGAVPAQPRYPSQPDHRTAVPVKSAIKPQTSYDAVPYSNGRTSYSLAQAQVQQPYSIPAAAQTQYTPRHQSATSSGSAGYPSSAPAQPRPPTATPYTSTPNMYLSNYSGNYRPLQNAHNPVSQPQHHPSGSHYSTARGQPALASTHTGGWPSQQAQYSQLASHQAWNGATHGTGSPHAASGTSAPQACEQPQQNGYYRSHPAQSNPLAPPHHLASAQPYYTGGPTSQS